MDMRVSICTSKARIEALLRTCLTPTGKEPRTCDVDWKYKRRVTGSDVAGSRTDVVPELVAHSDLCSDSNVSTRFWLDSVLAYISFGGINVDVITSSSSSRDATPDSKTDLVACTSDPNALSSAL